MQNRRVRHVDLAGGVANRKTLLQIILNNKPGGGVRTTIGGQKAARGTI